MGPRLTVRRGVWLGRGSGAAGRLTGCPAVAPGGRGSPSAARSGSCPRRNGTAPRGQASGRYVGPTDPRPLHAPRTPRCVTGPGRSAIPFPGGGRAISILLPAAGASGDSATASGGPIRSSSRAFTPAPGPMRPIAEASLASCGSWTSGGCAFPTMPGTTCS
jgi:hypothetical protein